MADLNLGLMWGYWGQLPPPNLVELTQEAERLEFTSVWTAESWGSDAFSPLAYLAAVTERIQLGTAVAQLAARTPTATAMHALTIDHLSNGRFNLGLGVSGPQVVEGWYGQPSNKPLARTREYVEIIRRVIAREERVDFQGEHYQHPYSGPGSVGLGKALKPITHPLRRRIPIFIGAEGPKNVTQTAEIADGWFPLYYSPWRQDVYADQLAGAADDFQVSVICPFVVTGPTEAEIAKGLAGIQTMLAFYIGGMGAEGQNYHTKLAARMGLGDAAMEIQRLFLSGDQAGAIDAVPASFADEIALVGPPERIKERLSVWRDSPVTTLMVHASDSHGLRTAAELVLGG
ncbi:MAG: LLM class F420-dependent oxidoreductase [Microthrixaceae bacterium]|nr:LLM class F420-dependent oxidoreductase [Microthrixaceae bacterium]